MDLDETSGQEDEDEGGRENEEFVLLKVGEHAGRDYEFQIPGSKLEEPGEG